MRYVIGTDEAGYGPNLGPLVIAASAWSVPDGTGEVDLYELLRDAVSAEADDQRLHLADSKVVYQPGKGLAALERGVLAALAALDGGPATFRQAFCRTADAIESDLDALPWHSTYDESLPLAATADEVAEGAARLGQSLARSGVKLMALRAVIVFPARFNALARRDSSKGETLTQLTLTLARSLLAELPPAPAHLVCDKHGGRNRYAAHLQAVFDEFVRVRTEGREESRYEWGQDERRVEASFRCRSERFLPAALASMLAKYLRELSMRAFNAFWLAQSPGLKPTAGYPQDARRFKAEIAELQQKLQVADDVLWRVK
jgi:ribonuclease HII